MPNYPLQSVAADGLPLGRIESWSGQGRPLPAIRQLLIHDEFYVPGGEAEEWAAAMIALNPPSEPMSMRYQVFKHRGPPPPTVYEHILADD